MTVVRLVVALALCGWLVPAASGAESRDRHPGDAVVTPVGRLVVTVKEARVSVRADDVSLRAVLAAIAREAGMRLTVRGAEDRRVTVRFEGLELADAIARVARADFVVGADRLIVFLTPPRPRSATMSVDGVPGVTAPFGDAQGAPGTRVLAPPPTAPSRERMTASPTVQRPPSASASSRRRSRSTAGNSGAVATIDPAGEGTPATSPAAAPTISAPGSARLDGLAGTGSAAQRVAGAIAGATSTIPPSRPVAASYVLDPAEARRLGAEVDARASEPSALDTSESAATEAALRKSLP